MVRRVLQLVYQEVRGLHQAAYILAVFALGSQLLAIVRDRLLAHTFGAGPELDIYYAAFRVPDVLFVLFASVLSVYVLLPFVSRHLETTILAQFFTLFLVSYSVVALVLALSAPWYVPLLFPGLATVSGELTLVLQILLLQPLLLGISNLYGVITQFQQRFVLYALSPIIYNIGIIVGVVVLYPWLGLAGLAGGVVLGAFGHLAIQWPYVRKSTVQLWPTSRIVWTDVMAVLLVAVPRAGTLALQQVVLLVCISIATLMTAGSVSVFQFAFNLQSVPLAIIGVSYSVAAFPTLSQLAARGERAAFNHQLLVALRHIIFWSLPVLVLAVVLRAQIVRVLLGSGSFDWSDTRLTAALLALCIMSLSAQAALLVLLRAFYASGRVWVPFGLGVVHAVGTIALAFGLWAYYVADPQWQTTLATWLRVDAVPGAEVLVLGVAYTLGAFGHVLLLLVVAAREFSLSVRPLGRLLAQSLTAALAGGVAAYATLAFVVDGINQETFVGIALQGVVAGCVGVLTVAATYYILRAPEFFEVVRAIRVRVHKPVGVTPPVDTP
jgi:putative peptidoglycan lipid II flippase